MHDTTYDAITLTRLDGRWKIDVYVGGVVAETRYFAEHADAAAWIAVWGVL